MKPIRLVPGAAGELIEATDWYDSRQPGLGLRFRDELEATLWKIQERPTAFPLLSDISPDLQVRRALLVRFPYAWVFMELEREIRVLAVAHGKRQAGYWLSRIKS
jgi:plasmid stabilization system protein ParE